MRTAKQSMFNCDSEISHAFEYQDARERYNHKRMN